MIEIFRDEVNSKFARKDFSGSWIRDNVEELLESLIFHIDSMKKKEIYDGNSVSRNFSSKEYRYFFKQMALQVSDRTTESENKLIRTCLSNESSIDRFRDGVTIEIKNLLKDFCSIAIGYAGWEGYKKGISIAECFYIQSDDEDFSTFNIEGREQRNKTSEQINKRTTIDKLSVFFGEYNIIGIEDDYKKKPDAPIKYYLSNWVFQSKSDSYVRYALKNKDVGKVRFIAEIDKNFGNLLHIQTLNEKRYGETPFFLQGYVHLGGAPPKVFVAAIVTTIEPENGFYYPYSGIAIFHKIDYAKGSMLFDPKRDKTKDEMRTYLGEDYISILDYLDKIGKPHIAMPYEFPNQ